jgi:glutathione S-transferase
MYRLFAAPHSYAMVAHSVLEELGVAYELAWVEIFTDKPDPAFLAASPHARVPALVHEHGTLYEAGAIALYLAEIQFHPEIYAIDADDQAKLQQASMKRLGRVLEILDEALEPGPYFFADRLTVCDFVLGMQATWPEVYPRSIDDYPNLKRLVVKVTERPSVRRVLDQHGLDKVAGS